MSTANTSSLRFIGSGTPMRELVRAHAWADTALGPVAGWSAPLRTAVGIVMHSAHPMFLWWGPQLIQIYNDGYVPCFGQGKHPAALGQAGRDCWPEIWHIIGPQIDSVMSGGEAQWYENKLVPIWRNGKIEDVYWSYTYTPVFGEGGAAEGVLVVCTETTAQVLAARRRATLDELNHGLRLCHGKSDMAALLYATAAANPQDLPALRIGAGSGDPAPGDVCISASELHIHAPLLLCFRPSAVLPMDRPYRQFLEQIVAAAGAALLRLEGDEALRQARAERDRLLLDAPVGTAIMVGPELVYDLANPVYCQIIGRDSAAVVGQPFARVFPELVDSPVHQVFQDVYRSGIPFVSEATLVHLHIWGEPVERYYIYNLAPLRRLDGAVYGLMAIGIDVTAQVLARHEIERLNTDLNRSLRSKDEFLAVLGHELRNPLAPIVSALELMRLRGAGTGPEQAVIQRQLDHLVRLVDDLLDVSRITSGKVELRQSRVKLDEVLGKAVEMASPLLERKRHRLAVDVPALDWHGDPARLAQVVSNLLNNAGRYTPDGGSITLRAHADAQHIHISVTDNGQGIAPDLLPVIFDLFVQGARRLDNAQGGLGVGLALVKNLVHLHGGQVRAVSDGPGTGSVFTITLPRPAARPALPAPLPVPAQAAAAGTAKRLLVVDDNRDAADSMADIVHMLGHSAAVFYTPASALAEAARHRFDMAILDIGLPGMDGYELAARLRPLMPENATMVALTGYGQSGDRERSVQAGFSAHLVKPINLAQLRGLLH